MTGFIPVPPEPWVPTATDSESKLFPSDTMDALDERNDGRYATTAQGAKADAAAPASTVYDKTASDARFATAAQGELADSAYQKPGTGVPKTDLAEAVQTSLGKADTALQPADVGTMAAQDAADYLTADQTNAAIVEGVGEGAAKSAIDPALLPNGVLAQATAGVLYGFTGGNNVVIDDGALTFLTPTAGGDGTATTHIHLETPNGQVIQYMRAIIEYPADATTPITFVFPGQAWVPGPGLTAGVHTNLICRTGGTPTAIIQGGGYPSGAPVNVAQRDNTLATPFPGRTVDVEHWFDKSTGRVLVYINKEKVLEYTDVDAIPHVSTFGDLEISGAGSASSVAPRILLFEISSEYKPPRDLPTLRESSNIASAVTVAATYADINSGAYVPVVFGPSGYALVTAILHLTQDSGTTWVRFSDGVRNSSQRPIVGAKSAEQILYMGTVAGTPNTRANLKLQAFHTGGGTATVRPASEVGPVIAKSEPFAPYVANVES